MLCSLAIFFFLVGVGYAISPPPKCLHLSSPPTPTDFSLSSLPTSISVLDTHAPTLSLDVMFPFFEEVVSDHGEDGVLWNVTFWFVNSTSSGPTTAIASLRYNTDVRDAIGPSQDQKCHFQYTSHFNSSEMVLLEYENLLQGSEVRYLYQIHLSHAEQYAYGLIPPKRSSTDVAQFQVLSFSETEDVTFNDNYLHWGEFNPYGMVGTWKVWNIEVRHYGDVEVYCRGLMKRKSGGPIGRTAAENDDDESGGGGDGDGDGGRDDDLWLDDDFIVDPYRVFNWTVIERNFDAYDNLIILASLRIFVPNEIEVETGAEVNRRKKRSPLTFSSSSVDDASHLDEVLFFQFRKVGSKGSGSNSKFVDCQLHLVRQLSGSIAWFKGERLNGSLLSGEDIIKRGYSDSDSDSVKYTGIDVRQVFRIDGRNVSLPAEDVSVAVSSQENVRLSYIITPKSVLPGVDVMALKVKSVDYIHLLCTNCGELTEYSFGLECSRFEYFGCVWKTDSSDPGGMSIIANVTVNVADVEPGTYRVQSRLVVTVTRQYTGSGMPVEYFDEDVGVETFGHLVVTFYAPTPTFLQIIIIAAGATLGLLAAAGGLAAGLYVMRVVKKQRAEDQTEYFRDLGRGMGKDVDGVPFRIMSLLFDLRHRGIVLRGKNEAVAPKSYFDVCKLIKASKYTSYVHCKFCYLEQIEGYHADLAASSGGSHPAPPPASIVCRKCGLPLLQYLEFTQEDLFCCVCALMNKYQPRPHGRCLLHPAPSGRKKKKKAEVPVLAVPDSSPDADADAPQPAPTATAASVGPSQGAVYVLFRDKFSVGSASRQRRKSQSSDWIERVTRPAVWKLNCLMRMEYLWLLRHLVRHDLQPDEESLVLLRTTLREVIERIDDIGPDMTSSYFSKLRISNLTAQFGQATLMSFFDRMRSTLVHFVAVLQRHVDYFERERRRIRLEERKRKQAPGKRGRLDWLLHPNKRRKTNSARAVPLFRQQQQQQMANPSLDLDPTTLEDDARLELESGLQLELGRLPMDDGIGVGGFGAQQEPVPMFGRARQRPRPRQRRHPDEARESLLRRARMMRDEEREIEEEGYGYQGYGDGGDMRPVFPRSLSSEVPVDEIEMGLALDDSPDPVPFTMATVASRVRSGHHSSPVSSTTSSDRVTRSPSPGRLMSTPPIPPQVLFGMPRLPGPPSSRLPPHPETLTLVEEPESDPDPYYLSRRDDSSDEDFATFSGRMDDLYGASSGSLGIDHSLPPSAVLPFGASSLDEVDMDLFGTLDDDTGIL